MFKQTGQPYVLHSNMGKNEKGDEIEKDENSRDWDQL